MAYLHLIGQVTHAWRQSACPSRKVYHFQFKAEFSTIIFDNFTPTYHLLSCLILCNPPRGVTTHYQLIYTTTNHQAIHVHLKYVYYEPAGCWHCDDHNVNNSNQDQLICCRVYWAESCATTDLWSSCWWKWSHRDIKRGLTNCKLNQMANESNLLSLKGSTVDVFWSFALYRFSSVSLYDEKQLLLFTSAPIWPRNSNPLVQLVSALLSDRLGTGLYLGPVPLTVFRSNSIKIRSALIQNILKRSQRYFRCDR